jgi:hypothetical protein
MNHQHHTGNGGYHYSHCRYQKDNGILPKRRTHKFGYLKRKINPRGNKSYHKLFNTKFVRSLAFLGQAECSEASTETRPLDL